MFLWQLEVSRPVVDIVIPTMLKRNFLRDIYIMNLLLFAFWRPKVSCVLQLWRHPSTAALLHWVRAGVGAVVIPDLSFLWRRWRLRSLCLRLYSLFGLFGFHSGPSALLQ